MGKTLNTAPTPLHYLRHLLVVKVVNGPLALFGLLISACAVRAENLKLGLWDGSGLNEQL